MGLAQKAQSYSIHLLETLDFMQGQYKAESQDLG